MEKYKSIVLSGGGSGGHVYPNISLLPILNERFKEIHYIGEGNSLEENVCKNSNVDFHIINAVKFKREFNLSNISIPYKLIRATKECEELLCKIKPSIVFSKGGYVSLPVNIAAKKQKIPVVIHESDYSLGLTNKICSIFADKVLITLPNDKYKGSKYILTGAPIRDEIIYSKGEKLFNNSKPILLVMGGSLGSLEINKIISLNFNKLINRFNIVHLCGKGKLQQQKLNKSYIQMEYSDNIGKLISSSDIIISRGGAGSLLEILALKKPTLVIPLANAASRGDQMQNAKYYNNRELIFLHKEKNNICDELFDMYKNRRKYLDNIIKANITDGKENIVKEIIESITPQKQ